MGDYIVILKLTPPNKTASLEPMGFSKTEIKGVVIALKS